MQEKYTVLIAEDSMVNRRILEKILSEEYTILEASDGAAALELLQQHFASISAVILDLRMPVLDGFEILRRISRQPDWQNIPVLVATGDQERAVEEECLTLGAWDFVSKPYIPSVLRLRLKNCIARSEMQVAKENRMLSQKDLLTGLYNRPYFLRCTQQLLQDHPDIEFVLVHLDVDRFRVFNSFFGSREGDALLQRLAENLCKTLQPFPFCTYGRIESDVFCVCIPYDKDHLGSQLEHFAQQVVGMQPNYRLKVSFGIYVIPDNLGDLEAMYSRASMAAEKCKNNYNCIYAYYDASMSLHFVEAQQIANEMEAALQQEQFHVYLQPKYALRSNLACGAEALVRWIHPERGMISPGVFIPVFEQNGFILQLDYYMWEKVCALLHKWMCEGHAPNPVSVNVSRVSLYDPQLLAKLSGLVEKYDIPARLLQLEITESAYMSHPELMKDLIAALRGYGFVILMDDFGSGYSSLNTLKDIDVDILKIDMKFLPTGRNNVKSEKILASITRMAGWLGMPVVVEGVETREQTDFLESIGCGYVQGFYFARPMPVVEYEQLIQEDSCSFSETEHSASAGASLDAYWSSDSQIVALLKGFSAPFALYEYGNHQFDLVRSNTAFRDAFEDINQPAHYQKHLSHTELEKLYEAFAQATQTHGPAECECLYIYQNGLTKWYRVRLQYIAGTNRTHLLSATFTDTTEEKRLTDELRRISAAMDPAPHKKTEMLIADDSLLSRELLKSIFQDEFTIREAEDGQQALEILQQDTGRLAVILLDIIMPNIDGTTFLAKKREIPAAANIPVVVISAENSETFQINMLKSGVNDYVVKPFVSEVVRQRVRNVLEYNSRFLQLVQEYNGSLSPIAGKALQKNCYTIPELRNMIVMLSSIFDLVRAVDPCATTVFAFGPDDTIRKEPYACFCAWGKNARCKNCTGIGTQQRHCQLSKFEDIENDLFYVVSHPISILEKDGSVRRCVLEVISRVSDRLLLERVRDHSVRGRLEHTRQQIYTDPLTAVYNRRYFDEMRFLIPDQGQGAQPLALILMDVRQFKQINDLYGHDVGDTVLAQVAQRLKQALRSHDCVIRFGGDEFVVILPGCNRAQAESTIARLRSAVSQVYYGPEGNMQILADFGCAYTDSFFPDKDMLKSMLQDADRQMYTEKRKSTLPINT